jgi:hypothetical protein
MKNIGIIQELKKKIIPGFEQIQGYSQKILGISLDIEL